MPPDRHPHPQPHVQHKSTLSAAAGGGAGGSDLKPLASSWSKGGGTATAAELGADRTNPVPMGAGPNQSPSRDQRIKSEKAESNTPRSPGWSESSSPTNSTRGGSVKLHGEANTTSSFTHTVSQNGPLSSHGASHQPSLVRGNACMVCRQRKVKCDGGRPRCSSCIKSAAAHGEDPQLMVCNYEDEKVEKRKRGPGHAGRIAALESENQHLKEKLAQLEQRGGHLEESQQGGSSSAANERTGAIQSPHSIGPIQYSPAVNSQNLLPAGTPPSMRGSGIDLLNSPSSTAMTMEGHPQNVQQHGQPKQRRSMHPNYYSVPPNPNMSRDSIDVLLQASMGHIPASKQRLFGLAGPYATPSSDSAHALRRDPRGDPHSQLGLQLSDPGRSYDHQQGDRQSRQGDEYSQHNSSSDHASSSQTSPHHPPNNSLAQDIPSYASPYTAIPPPDPEPDPLLSLFYPGWPTSLPSPLIVQRLLDVYFSKSHATSGMIHQGRFMARMTLPPSHAEFPHIALLHALLATSSRMVSEDFFNGEEKYWKKEVVVNGNFHHGGPRYSNQDEGGRAGGTAWVCANVSDYHAFKAKAAIQAAFSPAARENLLQVAQAMVLLCFDMYTSARFFEVWLFCGLATRIGTPLGLNHIRSVPRDPTVLEGEEIPKIKVTMMPPTDDQDELFERSATFWLGFSCDRFASASTGWAMSLDEDDITSLLPCPPGYDYPTDMLSSPLSPQSPKFFYEHPPSLVQSLQLYIKAIVLLGRVTSYRQRSPSPFGTGIPKMPSGPGSYTPPVDLRKTAEFQKLDQDATTFRLSIPREYSNIQEQNGPDNRMCLVFAVPHTATILLHEPFCTMADGDPSLAKCLSSARAILESIYTLWSTSFEIGLLCPFINFTWAVAGRTLVRDLAIRQAKGVTQGIPQLKTDISTILAAMRAYRSPLGDSTATALQTLLDNPPLCRPSHDLKHLGVGFGPDTVPEKSRTWLSMAKFRDRTIQTQSLKNYMLEHSKQTRNSATSPQPSLQYSSHPQDHMIEQGQNGNGQHHHPTQSQTTFPSMTHYAQHMSQNPADSQSSPLNYMDDYGQSGSSTTSIDTPVHVPGGDTAMPNHSGRPGTGNGAESGVVYEMGHLNEYNRFREMMVDFPEMSEMTGLMPNWAT